LWKTIKKIKQVKKYSAPLRTSQGTWARTNIDKAHVFTKHLAKAFSHIPQEMNLKRKKHLPISWKPPTNSDHQSTALKDQEFKKSSTD
jgi:hypothetical protein